MPNQMLNFMVRSTCEVLGLTFSGTTEEEKRAFIERHLEARTKAVSSLLDQAHQEMISQDSEVS